MPGTNRMGAPKHLEKMLFINHKEDMLLDDKLHELKLRSRYKAMELDRERIKVQNELRNSRKKNLTLNEAISAGLLPQPAMPSRSTSFAQLPLARQNTSLNVSRSSISSNGRGVSSAPAQRKHGTVERPSFMRSSSFAGGNTPRRETTNKRLSLHPVIPEADENGSAELFVSANTTPRRDSVDTVGEYVLCEFEKMSQVVPDILRALARKKEKQQERDERENRHTSTVPDPKDITLIDYEPDMNKVRKTVMSVKTLRHRMAISKRLNSVKPQRSLEQMIQDKINNAGEHDEYTDGTCALMKRRLEKKRRDSESDTSDGPPVPRRHSMFGSIPDSCGNSGKSNNGDRKSVSLNLDKFRQRSASVVQFPSAMSRQATSLGFGSASNLGSLGLEPDGGAQLIDEDVLRNKQRVMRELDKYELIRDRVNRFLIQGSAKTSVPVFEEIIPIK